MYTSVTKNTKNLLIFVTLVGMSSAHASSPLNEDASESLSLNKIRRVISLMSIPRPHNPIDGNPNPDRSGLCFNGKMIYFGKEFVKFALLQALTGQSSNPNVDVLKHLVITREDFDNLEIIREDFDNLEINLMGTPGFKRYSLTLKKEEPILTLNRLELVVLIQKLGEAFGLSDDEIQKKINSLP